MFTVLCVCSVCVLCVLCVCSSLIWFAWPRRKIKRKISRKSINKYDENDPFLCVLCVRSVCALCVLCVGSVWALCVLCVCSVWALCALCVRSVWALCGLCVCSVRALCLNLFRLTLHIHIFSSKATIVIFGTFRSALPLQVRGGSKCK